MPPGRLKLCCSTGEMNSTVGSGVTLSLRHELSVKKVKKRKIEKQYHRGAKFSFLRPPSYDNCFSGLNILDSKSLKSIDNNSKRNFSTQCQIDFLLFAIKKTMCVADLLLSLKRLQSTKYTKAFICFVIRYMIMPRNRLASGNHFSLNYL